MKDIAIYGAGGFGREVFCLLRRINEEVELTWNIIGFFDDGVPVGDSNEYGKILGNIDTLNDWESPLSIVFAIGSPKVVNLLYDKINNPNIDFPNICAPDLLFLDRKNVRMGIGNVFCSRCLVSCNVEIGNFNTFNGYIAIGHDSIIGDFNSVMPAVKVSGGVKIGNRNFLGVNSVILQYKEIGNDTTIGASSVVLRNTKDGYTYVGNPAKKIEY
ncbi:MAG: NeuD/PglB/VioB family sugar acetyltransferase [Muribaculaceae bacterium]|nr:NeuD/PglB/VioB family sugar acetyltransferase [Muribaculaceae bacterium]